MLTLIYIPCLLPRVPWVLPPGPFPRAATDVSSQVGGDLSGAEGLKAAFTLTLLGDLETRAAEQVGGVDWGRQHSREGQGAGKSAGRERGHEPRPEHGQRRMRGS